MRIEKLIEKLQEFKSQYGDIEVYNSSSGYIVECVETGDCGEDEEMYIVLD
ncbi:hypothetical protein C672_3597 [[Clostridium] bifermentans ATCC 638]|uniref:Uncharacterized protein n=1 Tax=Paraclostridium bifermentans ATCC 638 = DSM 14991 TaxID=1233171 RepID=T4V7W6_PARBF|nr:hypothetical protein [Paraclostridium bifermentans]EQK39819.1 hypothetical protein C672_3597 [[Clostridium] bifermentans ATCC 638] [Paraclostridium bifermentans ATCC 638 = DSM 14991]